MKRRTIILLCFISHALCCMAQGVDIPVKPAHVFQSHMVLQQEMPVKIWGTAPAGTTVPVQLDKEKKQAVSDASGKWLADFPARKASRQPIRLRIGDLVLEDILVGEVWLCSGQSNMVRNLKTVDPDVLPKASLPELRILNYNHDGVPLVSKKGYTDKELVRCNTADFFRGQWEVSNEQSAALFSAVAWYFGRELQKDRQVPVGLIKVAVGGSVINNWISPATLQADPVYADLFTSDWGSNPLVERTQQQRGKEAFQHIVKNEEPWLPGKLPYRWLGEPGFLFEAGIEPLKELVFRGVLWYQGESDAIDEVSTQRYRELFPMMIRDWRTHFGKNDLPFLFVQLPGFRKETWPDMRQIQSEVALEVPHTWMAVAIDLGLKDDVHPLDKEPVGKRLHLLAKEYVYGKGARNVFTDILKVTPGSGRTVIVFKPGHGNLKRLNDSLPGFETAGEDGSFAPARAYMTGSNTVTIEHAGKIAAVRYGWQPFPEPALQLFDEAGLPVGPFVYKL